MNERYKRTALILTPDGIERLNKAKVAVFGLGGVGGYAVEALARAGVGTLALIDNDTVSKSNINRQIYALESTVGKLKTEVAKARVSDINPDIEVKTFNTFILPENVNAFDFSVYDYVIDAIDTVSGKLAIIETCYKLGVPVISSMGTGNKLDPTRFEVVDVYHTSVCPLAKVMRKELKERGIKKLKVVYSTETPIAPIALEDADLKGGRIAPGSVSFVPPVAGMILAGEVIKDLVSAKKE